MTTEARAVIIGGGVVGCSVAHHLTTNGWSDVILLERAELTSGSTWHAAGLVPNFIGDLNMAKVHQEAVALYPRIEEETGLSSGWHGCGAVRLARNQDEVESLREEQGRADEQIDRAPDPQPPGEARQEIRPVASAHRARRPDEPTGPDGSASAARRSRRTGAGSPTP